jgi:hypothetical protein
VPTVGARSQTALRTRTLLPRTGSSWIAVALASSSVMHAARAGREREPGQDTWMPPRHEEGLRDDRVPGDPGRSRAEGRTPARGHPAGLDAGRRPGPRNVAAGLAGAVQGRRAAGGCGCSACPALPAVTLSHAEGHGERAHCRRSGGKYQTADMPSEPHSNDHSVRRWANAYRRTPGTSHRWPQMKAQQLPACAGGRSV